MTRKATWSNADGLVVGFGANIPERQATAEVVAQGSYKELVMDFTFESTSPALAIPAGFVITGMYLKVGTAWVSTGTVTMTIGDGGDADGWFTATLLTEAGLLAGVFLAADGAYTQGDDGGSAEPLNRAQPKLYATADTIDVAVSTAGNAPQSGTAKLVVIGHQL